MKKTEEERNRILKEYGELNISAKKLAKKHSIPQSTLLFWLHKYNIPIRKKEWNRKYSLNQNYFNKINTEEKAYILGLLYADGYHNEKLRAICISLQENDYDILERINSELNSDRPIKLIKGRKFYNNNTKKWYTSKNQRKLNLNSKILSENLKKLGLIQTKSLILKFPTEDQVPKYLLKFFIKGYFDGDGSAYLYLRKDNHWRASCEIVSSRNFNEGLKKVLEELIKIKIEMRHDKRCKYDTTSIRISSKYDSLKFLQWLYENSKIHIQRKYDKYLEIKSLVIKCPKQRKVERNIFKDHGNEIA